MTVRNYSPYTTESPEYNAWKCMIYRCHLVPENDSGHYKYYRGAGITVCDEWRASFMAFVNSVGPRPTPKHSLDRYPNPYGNYEPGNVRWATAEEQANNRRQRQPLEEPRCALLSFKVNDQEWAQIKHDSRGARSLSEYLRGLILQGTESRRTAV